ncbi:MAG: squalene/phytoene synthase family protein [Rhodospirillales bacterium]|nr:squalene/phytoene synthase family protein [Alphaproteobacteria bacterium]MCB9976521.1 squalene/phytoene synthase family protein [Rhodospirillales bacterium]
MGEHSLSSCGQIVRDHDRDRFLLSMFAPPECREDLWALFAYNHELAKTREVVSDSTLGLIRLQWWRDAIASVYENKVVPDNEIVQGLSRAIKAHDLPREPFETLAYAREFDLENVSPGNLEGLLNYSDFTSTPLMKLAVKITGDDPDMEPVYPIAVNYALAGVLRAVPAHAGQGRCYLPEDLMVKHIVTKEKLFLFERQAGLPGLLAEIAEVHTRGIRPDNPFLKASGLLAEIYFRHLKARKYNIFDPQYALEPAFKVLRLTLGAKFIPF